MASLNILPRASRNPQLTLWVCLLQAEFPRLHLPLVSAIAACLLQSRPLKCAPLPFTRAAPGLHPGLEAALHGDPWQYKYVPTSLLEVHPSGLK